MTQAKSKQSSAPSAKRISSKAVSARRPASATLEQLQTKACARASQSLGPTLDEILAEDFNAAEIEEINQLAASKVESTKAFLRKEAAEKSSSLGVLRKLREVSGVSQKDMARMLVVSAPAVSKMENGDPQMSSVLLYANALGRKVSLMIEGAHGEVLTSIKFGTLAKAKASTKAKAKTVEARARSEAEKDMKFAGVSR